MDSCVICSRGNERADVVFEDAHWIVRHSGETNIGGYLLIESRRHFLDMSEATAEEAASYGGVLSAAMRAVREVVGPERVYTFSLAEAVPHYHLHVIPRRADFPRAYRARGIMQYPLQPAVDPAIKESICERLRRAFPRTLQR